MKIPILTFTLKFLKSKLNYDKIRFLWIKSNFKKIESIISHKVEFKNPQRMIIGKGVVIQPDTWIAAMVNDLPILNAFDPWITIKDGVYIGRFCQITVSNSLIIEENVLITEGVLITDTIHGYENINVPIVKQRMYNRGPIVIKSGAWIGNGARLVGSLTVGKNSVVGANCYLDKDVPDYCIVGGIPARIIKRYDPSVKRWINVNVPLNQL
jgi:acetyltransferase-like isoleucine patch superfamily enzyme